jgi:hypothetical protein
MESIISKVHVELIDLAATYAEAGYENVTLSLISDFQRALFTVLDEKTCIKDLEQSEKLRDEMVQLFKNKKPTKIAWPYLDRLKKEDRGFAELDCMFKHRAVLYKSPLSEEQFVRKNYQSSPCLAKHKHALGQEHRARDDTKNAKTIAVDVENLSTEPLVEGDLGKKMSGNEKSDDTHAGERLLSKGDLDNKRLPKAVVKETVGKAKSAKDVQYHLVDNFSYDRGGSSSDESEWDDDVVNGEGINWQNADVGR